MNHNIYKLSKQKYFVEVNTSKSKWDSTRNVKVCHWKTTNSENLIFLNVEYRTQQKHLMKETKKF